MTLSKAWKEMIHRHLAMVVGALIAAITLHPFAIAVSGIKQAFPCFPLRSFFRQHPARGPSRCCLKPRHRHGAFAGGS